MFDLVELIVEFLPEFVSIGSAAQAVRDDAATFDQRLAVFTAVTLAQQQRQRSRTADRDEGTRR